jgi:hypothetical protein
VIEVSFLRLLLVTIIGWLDRRERALAYLIEENRLTLLVNVETLSRPQRRWD